MILWCDDFNSIQSYDDFYSIRGNSDKVMNEEKCISPGGNCGSLLISVVTHSIAKSKVREVENKMQKFCIYT